MVQREESNDAVEPAEQLRGRVEDVGAVQWERRVLVRVGTEAVEQNGREVETFDCQAAPNQLEGVVAHSAADLEHRSPGREARPREQLIDVATDVRCRTRNHRARHPFFEVGLLGLVVARDVFTVHAACSPAKRRPIRSATS